MPSEHAGSPLPRLGSEPAYERRLADTGVPADEQEPALTSEKRAKMRVERRLLQRPSDERIGR